MTEDPQIRLKRLRFRAWHRGTKEADLILGGFADAHLAGLSARELDDFEALLEAPESDVVAWVSGTRAIPDAYRTPLMKRLRAFDFAKRSP